MKNLKRVSLFICLLSLCGCASISSVSETSIPARRQNPITVQTSKLIILGMNFNNDFVDDIVSDLKAKCRGGVITGILTKDEVIDYFLMLAYDRQITVTGYCLKRQTASRNRKRQSL